MRYFGRERIFVGPRRSRFFDVARTPEVLGQELQRVPLGDRIAELETVLSRSRRDKVLNIGWRPLRGEILRIKWWELNGRA